jgi:hypothetical protein
MKRCYVCEETKPLEQFYKSKNRKDGHSYECKVCRSKQNKIRYKNNKEKLLAQSKSWIKANPNKQKQYDLKKKYNITIEEYKNLKENQNYSCAICKNPLNLGFHTHLDHCHVTKKARGILCSSCNLGIGKFKDNIKYLQNAIEYLKKHTVP